ncbi:RING finger domain-containing protein [Endozoicomonas lisbonensis]|uniref:RING-type domain-containing protein n=1 Tax=Endozoicomonas lisbonensis TaxID=3120522 RepID=A0ABV2SG23_9GAMM
MVRTRYKTIYVAAFVSVLLVSVLPAVSLHAFAAPFFGGETGLVQVEKNFVGNFIRVGKDITYRRYFYYFTTKEGIYALLSGLAQMLLTGYVDYQVAREVRNLAPSPFLKHAGFLLTLYSLPLMVRSTTSWYMSKRLTTEQIIIDSPHIQNRFYLELSYNPSGSGEVLKILPVPASIVRSKLNENNQQPSPALDLWNNFYKVLLKKDYVSVELSWFEHDTKAGILVNFINGAGDKQSRIINVEHFKRERLPASIESLLHNEWKPDSHLQHFSINLPVISLLKGDVIQRVMELVLSEDKESVVIPSGSLLTFISSAESGLPYEINLCREGQVYCDTILQLFWRPLPYPHYRLALKFADSGYIRHHESVLRSTLAQPGDINLAEQLTQLFEKVVFSAVMEFIRQQQEYTELSLPESGKVLVANDLVRYSTVEWIGILRALKSKPHEVDMDKVCIWLTNNGFAWPEFFQLKVTSTNRVQTVHPISPSLLPILTNLPPRAQWNVLDILLNTSPIYFFAAFKKLTHRDKIKFLRASEGDETTITEILSHLDENQVNAFTDLLVDSFKFENHQHVSLTALLSALPEEAKDKLINSLTAVFDEEEEDLLFSYIIKNKKTEAFRILVAHPENAIQDKLAKSIVAYIEEGGDIWQNLFITLPAQENFIKKLVLYISQHCEPSSISYNFLGTLSTKLLESPKYDDDLLLFLIAELAKNGFISAASQLVIAPDMLHRSMEKALEASNPNLYTGLARVSSELYLQHILSNYSDNGEKAQEWLKHLPADTQEKLITIGLDADQAGTDFLLNNTRPEAVAQSVLQYLQKSEQKRNNWERMQINHGMLTLKLVINHQCKPCMPPLLQWLSAKSGDQLTEGLANLELPEEQTRWFADTTVSMINSKEIEPAHITGLLVGIAKNLSFRCIKALIEPLPETVSTSLMIGLEEQLKQRPEHFATALESLSELQAGHYLATLTNSQELWENSLCNAYMTTQKLVTSLHAVARFQPNEAHFETIKGWSRTILSTGNFVKKKDLQEDLACSICQEVFKQPVVLPCGHTSCRGCITEWVQHSRSCPNCRLDIFRDWTFPSNHALEKLINNRKLQSE